MAQAPTASSDPSDAGRRQGLRDVGFREFRVLGCRVWDLGFRVLGFRIQGLGF